jgi:hypothetical protein
LLINLGKVEEKRFELFELGGRVFKAPGIPPTAGIKNVLDKVKRDLANSPFSVGVRHKKSKLRFTRTIRVSGYLF